MSGGVARQLADKYKCLEREYKEYCEMNSNNYDNLKGKVFKIMIQGKFIMNMFSQEANFDTDYKAMEIALTEIKDYAKSFKLSIAIPYGIGCGIANGNWDTVYEIIEEVFSDYDVILYRLEETNAKM